MPLLLVKALENFGNVPEPLLINCTSFGIDGRTTPTWLLLRGVFFFPGVDLFLTSPVMGNKNSG